MAAAQHRCRYLLLHRLQIELIEVRLLVSVIQRGTRVLISLWDALMFGRVPRPAAPGQYRRVLEYLSHYEIR